MMIHEPRVHVAIAIAIWRMRKTSIPELVSNPIPDSEHKILSLLRII